INVARGLAKSYGERLKGCSARNLNPQQGEDMSPELRAALEPLLKQIESLSESIRECKQRIECIAQEHYPETALLKQVKGRGTLVALTYVQPLPSSCAPLPNPTGSSMPSHLLLDPPKSSPTFPAIPTASPSLTLGCWPWPKAKSPSAGEIT